MEQTQTQKIELLLSEIDNALLRLYYARENGYEDFHFTTTLRDLLTCDQVKSQAEERLKKLFAVFVDLDNPVGYIATTYKEVDEVNKTVTCEVVWHFPNKKYGVNRKEIINIPMLEGASKESYHNYSLVPTPISKWSHYLGETETNQKDFFMRAQLAYSYPDLFKDHGIIDSHRKITFEVYIEELINFNNLKRQTENNDLIDMNLPKNSNRLVLLEKLGIIQFLISKHDTQLNNRPGNLASLISMILGITNHDEKETFAATLRHLMNKTSNKSPDNPKARKLIDDELHKIGIVLNKKSHNNKN